MRYIALSCQNNINLNTLNNIKTSNVFGKFNQKEIIDPLHSFQIIGDNKFIEKLRIIIEIDKESITDGVSFIDYDVGREEYHQYDYYKCTRMLIKIKVFLYPIIFYYFK